MYRARGLLLGISATISPASAQTYPTRPIRIVVPLPPGSNGDLMPRILGQHLATRLGQPVVIENRSGAAQNLGAEYVSRAEPDGYTLLATPQGLLGFVPNLPFDPSAFVPVTVMAKLPSQARLPASSLPYDTSAVHGGIGPDTCGFSSAGSLMSAGTFTDELGLAGKTFKLTSTLCCTSGKTTM